MTFEHLRYDKMVENALRGVVGEALREVAERGLPGSHHFYISFRTGFPGVEVPPYLREQYPDEMTIVLQYQFYGLDVEDGRFGVTLSFNNVHERLVIPFAAITTFADPSVNFALQFQALGGDTDDIEAEIEPPPQAEPAPAKEEKMGEVVALDAFRKKH